MSEPRCGKCHRDRWNVKQMTKESVVVATSNRDHENELRYNRWNDREPVGVRLEWTIAT
jgi:hypothetical protein